MQRITTPHQLVFVSHDGDGHPDARRRRRSRDADGTRGARCDGRALPSEALARVLVPEGGVGAARHAARDRARRPRVRARHPRPLPRDLRRLAAGRAALRDPGRGVRGPVARAPGRDPRRRAVGVEPVALLRDPQGRPARPRARGPRRLDHRHAPRAVPDPRGRAEARLGRAPRALAGESARRLDARPPSTPTSRSASCR